MLHLMGGLETDFFPSNTPSRTSRRLDTPPSPLAAPSKAAKAKPLAAAALRWRFGDPSGFRGLSLTALAAFPPPARYAP